MTPVVLPEDVLPLVELLEEVVISVLPVELVDEETDVVVVDVSVIVVVVK